MSITMENLLPDEDYLRIETNMLGAPLSVYKLKPSYIRFIGRIGLFIFLTGVVILALVIFSFFRAGPGDQSGLLITTLLPAFYLILKGGVFYRFDVKRARSERMIVCERGLLHIFRRIRKDQVEVVFWKDVQEVSQAFIGKSHYLTYRGGLPITLSGSLENLDELVETIRERSEVEEAPGDSL